MPLFSRSATGVSQPAAPSAPSRDIGILELIRAVTEQEWHEISSWAARNGHPDLSQNAVTFRELRRSGRKGWFSETELLLGLSILREAHSLGFQLSDAVLDVARRMNINLDEPINS
jgi:hypothetical protein